MIHYVKINMLEGAYNMFGQLLDVYDNYAIIENNIVVSLEYKYYELMKFYDECKKYIFGF